MTDAARLIDAPVLDLLKQDRRTRVWSVRHAGRVRVIKRFEDPGLLQRLRYALGLHPGQRESRRARALARAGIPAVAPIAHHWDGRHRLHLVFEWRGQNLQTLLQKKQPLARRRALAQQVAQLTHQLFALKLRNRDHKLTNLLVDDDGRLYLIDVGGVGRSPGRRSQVAMLWRLHETARKAGASRTDCWATLRALLALSPELGSARTIARRVNQPERG